MEYRCQSMRPGTTTQCDLRLGHLGVHRSGAELDRTWIDEITQAHCGAITTDGDGHTYVCMSPASHTGLHGWVKTTTGERGKEEVTPGGALRDPHPERTPANWFSVDYETVRAVAETHHEGDTRYGMGNWRKGLPASNLLNHAMEHLFLMLEGDISEPHLEHAIWNLGKLRWMAKHKPELIDVPMVRQYFGLPPVEGK